MTPAAQITVFVATRVSPISTLFSSMFIVDQAEQAIIVELGASSMKDMGRVMGEVKARHASSIEPARASALVKAALA